MGRGFGLTGLELEGFYHSCEENLIIFLKLMLN